MSTVTGALASVPPRAAEVLQALQRQEAALDTLAQISRDGYRAALSSLDAAMASGDLLRGEVLDRWREHVGTNAMMQRLQDGVSRVRSRLRMLLTRSSDESAAVQDKLETDLEVLIVNAADRAAAATVARWEQSPGGPELLDGMGRGVDRASPGLPERVRRELRDWQDGVLQLVRDQAGNRLAAARVVSVSVNTVGVALMVTVFAQTGGVTGAEAGVAAGTAAVSQALLTAIFGDNALRELVKQARRDLATRIAGQFELERSRFDQRVDEYSLDDEVNELRAATDELTELLR